VAFVLGLNPTSGASLWGTKVNLGGGELVSISSNPGLGAFFVCGAFIGVAGAAGPVDLLPGSLAFGAKDVVVAKINASTGAIMWAKNYGAAGDDVCTAVTSSDDGASVYIAGTYTGGALDFGTGALPVAAANQARLYVAKLDGATGATVSAAAYSTTGRQFAASLVADSSGNIYIGGGFGSTLTFAAGMTITSEGSTDAFVAKFNANLVAQWARGWGGGAQVQSIKTVATDSAGHVFAGGLFTTSISIGAGGSAVASAGGTDAFTMKLDQANGNVACYATYGDGSSQETDAITVARFATGSGMDKAMFGGLFASVINFGPVSLDTGNGAINHGFVAAMNANSF
jgi:hypothetical protein